MDVTDIVPYLDQQLVHFLIADILVVLTNSEDGPEFVELDLKISQFVILPLNLDFDIDPL